MENAQGRKEELQGMIDSRQKQLDEGTSLASQNVIYSEIAAFEAEIAAIEEAEQNQAAAQVRIGKQEEKVATLTLPYDFNELYSDSTANDTIIEVVQLFLREANDEHNTEVQTLIDAHKEEIRAAGERELQLKRQNDELQDKVNNSISLNDRLINENGDLKDQVSQLKLDKEDAEAKRDAAVRDKEAAEALLAEKQAHIDTLRDEIAIGASKAISVTNINPSERLAELVEQSKSAKIKSAREIALENPTPFRGPVVMGVVAPPIALEAATFPNQASNTVNDMDQAEPNSILADHQEVGQPATFQVQSGHDMAETNSPVEMAGKTIEEAFRRIEQLELTVYGHKAEVA